MSLSSGVLPARSGWLQRLRFQVKAAWIQVHSPSYWRYSSWRHGLVESEVALLPVLCTADRLSVDVGACNGLYTCPLLGCSRGCVAFEPLPARAALLRRAFGRHGARFRCEQVALGDTAGTAELRAPIFAPGYATVEPENRFAGMVDTSQVERYDVPLRTLDSYGLEDVGFVKIDVEGHEEAVLRGARGTLERDRPALVVEVEERHKAGSVQAVHRFLTELGYEAHFLLRGQLHPFERFDPTRHQDVRRGEDYLRNFIYVQGAARDRLRAHFSRP
ncbi:MAG: FkbM family methyltransferase [bacterium]